MGGDFAFPGISRWKMEIAFQIHRLQSSYAQEDSLMNIVSLATETAQALAPALPALIFIGTESAKAVVKKTTDAALNAEKKLWDKLRPHAPEGSALAKAAQDVAAHPDNPRPVQTLEWELEKLFQANPQLAQEIEHVVKQIAVQQNTVTVSGAGAVGIGGSASGNAITTNVNQK
jgi:hypothetical protein